MWNIVNEYILLMFRHFDEYDPSSKLRNKRTGCFNVNYYNIFTNYYNNNAPLIVNNLVFIILFVLFALYELLFSTEELYEEIRVIQNQIEAPMSKSKQLSDSGKTDLQDLAKRRYYNLLKKLSRVEVNEDVCMICHDEMEDPFVCLLCQKTIACLECMKENAKYNNCVKCLRCNKKHIDGYTGWMIGDRFIKAGGKFDKIVPINNT